MEVEEEGLYRYQQLGFEEGGLVGLVGLVELVGLVGLGLVSFLKPGRTVSPPETRKDVAACDWLIRFGCSLFRKLTVAFFCSFFSPKKRIVGGQSPAVFVVFVLCVL